jgi:muconolactone delta-isomerase
MEFLVEFDIHVPDGGVPPSEISDRQAAEADAAAKLAEEGHLVRVWRRPFDDGQGTVLGLYRADSEAELRRLLDGLPLREWMHMTVTPLAPHPNDPAATRASHVDAAP